MQNWGTHRPQQEREARGYTWLQSGIVTSVAPVVAAFVGIAITAQQVPDLGRAFVQSGVQGPNVRAPVTDTVITKQETPFHPGPYVQAGKQGPNVRPPISDSIFTVQRLPDHPLPFVQWNVITQFPLGKRDIFTKQEAPFHPNSFIFGPHPPPISIQPGKRDIFTRQEYPFHPNPYVFGPPSIPAVVPPNTRYVITKLEQPFHPGPFIRGVDNPNNSIVPQPAGFPPLQENLTKDMLGSVDQGGIFYTDPGLNRQLLTSIDDPEGSFSVVGWYTPGGTIYSLGNFYNKDIVQPLRPLASWFSVPDLAGGWQTVAETQQDSMMSLVNQSGFFSDPLLYNDLFDPVGWYIIGGLGA